MCEQISSNVYVNLKLLFLRVTERHTNLELFLKTILHICELGHPMLET
jgi:hypothetical protein